jgi:uncharacterized membrane protein
LFTKSKRPINHRLKRNFAKAIQDNDLQAMVYYYLAIGSLSSFLLFLDVVFPPTGNAWLQMPWMHVKLGFVLCCIYIMQNANKFIISCRNEVKYTTNFMRLWNEGALDSFLLLYF